MAAIKSVEKIPSVPSVHLVIQSPKGQVLGLLGGQSAGLAQALEAASRLDDFPVQKREDNVISVGQDSYDVDREYVLAIRGLFLFEKYTYVRDLERLIPSDCKLTFVVSY